MNNLLKTTLATAFAAACLAGASVTFAADNNGGNNPGSGISSKDAKGMNNNDSDVLQTDPTQTNSTTTTCDNNSANQQNCMKNGMQNTPQTQQ
jgi:hypothetical protein